MGRFSVLLFCVTCAAAVDVIVGAKFLFAMSKKGFFDVDFKVTVTAQGLKEGESQEVYLDFRPKSDTSRRLQEPSTLEFNKDGVKTKDFIFRFDQFEQYLTSTVVLSATVGNHLKTFDLDFTAPSGYIFIQTDKPVYLPGQTVRFRIIAVDEHQRLPEYPVKVEIRNDKNVILDQLHYSAEEAFKGQEFVLPRETQPGNWSIDAKFDTKKLIEFTRVYFEVKEYTLPRFYSTVKVNKDVITRKDAWITVTVKAMMVYGKPVLGTVVIQFGLWNSTMGIKLLDHLVQGPLNNRTGIFEKYIRVKSLFPRTKEEFPHGSRLYMNIIVTESGTQEIDNIIDTSTVIDNPYYQINLNSASKFKPGFPYRLQLHAEAKNGKPASSGKMRVKAYYFVKNSKKRHLLGRSSWRKRVGSNGDVEFLYDHIPETAKKIVFRTRVYTLGNKAVQRFTIPKFESKNNEYLQVSLKNSIKKNKDGLVELRYTRPSNSRPHNVVNRITVLVIARGQILKTKSVTRNNDGRSFVSLPRDLYTKVTPRMRVVAFYQVEEEPIMDSLEVDTDDVCLEELSLENDNVDFIGTYKPKDQFSLRVNGGDNMRVGLVAVDQAVLLVNNAESVSREKLFKQLGRNDQGVDDEDVEDPIKAKAFENYGLQYAIIDSDAPYYQQEKGLVGRVRNDTRRKVAGTRRMISGNNFFDTLQRNGHEIRPQSIRKYFPESWLFEEHTLSNKGRLVLRRTLPDSITTWSFLAVGISADRGICVSKRYEEEVRKSFFAEIRLPYKVRRLEEVKVKVAVYNYASQKDITVALSLTGSKGLCFPKEDINKDPGHNKVFYNLTVASMSTKSLELKVIPLRIGELSIEADLIGTEDRDTVERKLLVVPEGRKVRKTLTVALDPEAKHVSHKTKRHRSNQLILSNTKLVKNTIDRRKKEQTTKIKLGLPKEVIFGSESCSVSVFGDLMGDIISHAVKQSKTLVDNPGFYTAEEVLNDLAPTVHALHYANQTGLLNDNLQKQARGFVKQAVVRLLKYKHNQAFRLTDDSKNGTWLTVFALKTLCFASKITYIDYQGLINPGFDWLKEKFLNNQFMEEDWNFSYNPLENRMKLSAEALIAIYVCGKDVNEGWNDIIIKTADFLKTKLTSATKPLVLAKVAYALHLVDNDSAITKKAVERLISQGKENTQGQIYWSSDVETNEENEMPFFYRNGPKASSIEATAYALMLFLEQNSNINDYDYDSIADWLNAQRNHKGAFVGAMDSAAAIQALSAFSLKRRISDVDLRCNLTLSDDHKHFFQFTSENAINLEKVDHVPVRKKVEVLTKGHGVGQMHLNLEYNVPFTENELCRFNLTVEAKETKIKLTDNMESNPLCSYCNFGCPPPPPPNTYFGNRNRRDLRNHPQASRKSICMRVCLEPLANQKSVPVTVEVEMLTGFEPVAFDIKKLKETTGILAVEFISDTGTLLIDLNKVSAYEPTCMAFRAIDEMEVARLNPASVVVREKRDPDASCSEKYSSPLTDQSLQAYCANIGDTNRGECRCYSGLCGKCVSGGGDLGLREIGDMGCKAEIAYQLRINNVTSTNQWTEIDTTILSVNKTTGVHNVETGNTASLVTPNSCTCLLKYRNNQPFYMLSSDVVQLLDRKGNPKSIYLLDHRSKFLHVTGSTPYSSFNAAWGIDPKILGISLKKGTNC